MRKQGFFVLQLQTDEANGSVQWKMTHWPLLCVKIGVDNSYLPDFLCGRWSYGVVLYEIFTMGRYFINSEFAISPINGFTLIFSLCDDYFT